jgi:hypothetical protein
LIKKNGIILFPKQERIMTDFPGIPGCKILNELGRGGRAAAHPAIRENLNRRTAAKIQEPFAYLIDDKSQDNTFEGGN